MVWRTERNSSIYLNRSWRDSVRTTVPSISGASSCPGVHQRIHQSRRPRVIVTIHSHPATSSCGCCILSSSPYRPSVRALTFRCPIGGVETTAMFGEATIHSQSAVGTVALQPHMDTWNEVVELGPIIQSMSPRLVSLKLAPGLPSSRRSPCTLFIHYVRNGC